MSDGFRIEGAAQLERLGQQLKDLGDKDLRKELFRGFTRATKPMKLAVKEAARRDLPKRGGLNDFVADSKIGTRTRVSGKLVGVRIAGTKKGHDLNSLDRGEVRHPVFGRPKSWVTQKVKAGWFTDTIGETAPAVRHELVQVIDDVAGRLSRG